MSENPAATARPAVLERAGLGPATLTEIDRLIVGCGGFVKELISFTAGESTVKDSSGQRLSAADALVDSLLREQLLECVPGSGGYSEEGGGFGEPLQRARVYWLVDPVDGTRPALLGGAFAVAACALVLEAGLPVAAAGWVYVPTLSTLYRGILAPDLDECLANGRPARAETDLSAEDLRRRYIAVGSDWHPAALPRSPMKLSAPGATAVHLTQLVQPGSDVAAVALSRYRPYDAAAGLVIAAAGGCRAYRLGADRLPEQAEEMLALLLEGCRAPSEYGPRTLVSAPAVAALLR